MHQVISLTRSGGSSEWYGPCRPLRAGVQVLIRVLCHSHRWRRLRSSFCSLVCLLRLLEQMEALVACLLCSALCGKDVPFSGLWSLNAETVYLNIRFLLGIGVGAEYPCGSVSASEQSEQEGVAKNAQHRWFTLATSTYPLPV